MLGKVGLSARGSPWQRNTGVAVRSRTVCPEVVRRRVWKKHHSTRENMYGGRLRATLYGRSTMIMQIINSERTFEVLPRVLRILTWPTIVPRHLYQSLSEVMCWSWTQVNARPAQSSTLGCFSDSSTPLRFSKILTTLLNWVRPLLLGLSPDGKARVGALAERHRHLLLCPETQFTHPVCSEEEEFEKGLWAKKSREG